jgi:hypothetical protein
MMATKRDYEVLHNTQHDGAGLEPGECFQGEHCDRL